MPPIRRNMKRLLLVSATLALATFPTAAIGRAIGHESASGDFAIALASGQVNHPRMISVRVVTSPSQRATGNYTMVCSKGYGAGSKSGRFSGYGRFTRQLRMPTSGPDACTVSASGSLSRGGRITVTLLGH
jgi:hypothetical protein